ncbi:hypothetical protein GE09DRAFT_8213 [Coniochaeta sp. 2T2.1]|nr:hypothetical protein GE09DRAFT_8213 [Coniochaeta sp. 2T2.1]
MHRLKYRIRTLVHPLYQFDMQSLSWTSDGQGANDHLSVFRDPAKLHDTFRSLESAMTQARQFYKLVSGSRPLGDSRGFFLRSSEEVDKLLEKLQCTIQEISPFALGETSLVRVCYVATTNSAHARHRTFFASRLAELLRRTGHDNVKDVMAEAYGA